MPTAIIAHTVKGKGVSFIENACACVTPESHKTAIEAMKMIQANII
jgi:nicotinamidase-related amidase